MSGEPPEAAPLDCLVIGGGPAGLAAASYLGRFRRRVLVVDAGDPRAAWIPESHNIPFFAQGIRGPQIVERGREHAARYGAELLAGEVTSLTREGSCFRAEAKLFSGERTIQAKRVLLATGSVDVEPALPDLPDAVRRGLIRYCPICDGYESGGRKVAVMGHGDRGLGEAEFIARTYGGEVTLLTLGEPLAPDPARDARLRERGIRVVEAPIEALEISGDRILAVEAGGEALRFEVLYSALGLRYRTELALGLGAAHDGIGALEVDAHCQTTVRGLYAAGDIVRGLDQILVGMGHAAIAATHIHNRCEAPLQEEGEGPE